MKALFAKHRDLLALAVGIVLGLPTLGTFGLIDPWETHYAEVARQMIVRHDWISPWWANEGFFQSKPVLLFWLEGLFLKAMRFDVSADNVIGGPNGGWHHPEWAIRLPGFLLALAGGYVLYLGIARVFGRKRALFGTIALWTMPGFAILSHQAITDMPLVAGIAGALGFSLLALHTDDNALVQPRTGPIAAGLLALAIVPQLLVVLFQGKLAAGSPETCLLPGHPACANLVFAHPKLTPLLQMSMWFVPTAAILMHAWDETKKARLFALGAWTCAAIAAMAKGPAGLVVPAGAVVVHLLSRRSLRDLLRFEIPVGLLICLTMIGPWYLALFARHGKGFLHELVGHHMFGRTLEHLHDTNDGEDLGIAYFIRQLGYATFPWAGLALVGAFRLRGDSGSRRDTARAALFGAAMLAFGLVSMMATKFHHYMLICIPPIAMLAGIELAKPRRVHLAVAAIITAVIGYDLAHAPDSFIKLMTYRYSRLWPSTHAFSTFFWIITAAAIAALVAGAIAKRARPAIFLPAAALACALLWVYLPRCAHDGGQRTLFERYYAASDRAGPLVAYQLNWKGENFYTGDSTAIFISTGAPFRKYIDERRAKDQRVVYAVTERARARGLRAELGATTSFEELVPADSCAEYTLVRAELAQLSTSGAPPPTPPPQPGPSQTRAAAPPL